MPEVWWEQGAFMFLLKRPEVESHYHFARQKDINSYQQSINCSDSSGPYQVKLHLPTCIRSSTSITLDKPDTDVILSTKIISFKL